MLGIYNQASQNVPDHGNRWTVSKKQQRSRNRNFGTCCHATGFMDDITEQDARRQTGMLISFDSETEQRKSLKRKFSEMCISDDSYHVTMQLKRKCTEFLQRNQEMNEKNSQLRKELNVMEHKYINSVFEERNSHQYEAESQSGYQREKEETEKSSDIEERNIHQYQAESHSEYQGEKEETEKSSDIEERNIHQYQAESHSEYQGEKEETEKRSEDFEKTSLEFDDEKVRVEFQKRQNKASPNEHLTGKEVTEERSEDFEKTSLEFDDEKVRVEFQKRQNKASPNEHLTGKEVTEERLKEFKRQLYESEREKYAIDEQCQQYKALFTECQREKEETRKRLTELERKLQEVEDEKDTIDAECQQYKAFLSECRSEKEETEKRLTELERELHEVEDEKGTIDAQCQQYKALLNECRREKEETEKRLTELERKLHEVEEERDTIDAQYQQDKQDKVFLNECRREKEGAEKRVKELERKRHEFEDEKYTIEALCEQYKALLTECRREKEEAEMRCQKLQQQWDEDIREYDLLTGEVIQLRSERDQLLAYRNTIADYQRQITELTRAKDDALTRLSKVAGAKLTHGNAAITDLSDDNRPTKIAEKFSELYDNAWTDAFEEIEDLGNNELDVINTLLLMLKCAFGVCRETEKDYEDRVLTAVHTIQSVTKGNGQTYELQSSVQTIKALCDVRLSMGNVCSAAIEKLFVETLPFHLEKVMPSNVELDLRNLPPKTLLYVKTCANLCWLMRIRDPAVHIHFDIERNAEFDQELFRQYTKSGTKMDYIVWPVLFLHEKGPLLAKGVAQPK